MLTDDIVGIALRWLNGDRAADIVLTDFISGLVYVLLSNGNGFTQTTFTATGCTGPAIPVLGDVNADGYKDLLLNCDGPKVPIYLNNGEGAFSYSG